MNKKTSKVAIVAIICLILVLVGATFAFISFNKSGKETGSNTEQNETSVQESSVSENSESPVEESSATSETSQSSSSSSSEEDVSDADADNKISTFGKMGEAYTLHGHFSNQGEDISSEEITDNFFEGDMNVTVTGAKVLDYSDDYFSSNENTAEQKSQFNNPKVMQINLTLENISAHQMSDVQYDFYANIFSLGIYNDLIPADTSSIDYVKPSLYFTGTEFAYEPHGDDTSYYHFELNPGESKDFTFYFMIDEEYLNKKDPFLAISSATIPNFGVLLTDITY